MNNPIQPDRFEGVISTLTHSAGSLGSITNGSITSGSNWPTANKAFYARILLPRPALVTSFFWVNGSAVAGNVDTGVFDGISLKKIASTGSVARSGTNAVQKSTLANPAFLPAGTYFLGQSSDTTTNSRTVSYDMFLQGGADIQGLSQQTSAFALPDPIVPAVTSGAFPFIFIGMFTQNCGL